MQLVTAFVILVVQQVLALDPAPPKWLPNKGFRTKGETRYMLSYSHEGSYTCKDAKDPFPSTGCLDKSNFKLVIAGLQRCGHCRLWQDYWTATFCSEKPINNSFYIQDVEYADDQCQEVASPDFPGRNDHMDALSSNPSKCGHYTDCTAECTYNAPGSRAEPQECDLIHGKDKGVCDKSRYCHWNEPPFKIGFYSWYTNITEFTFGYVCYYNQCVISEKKGSDLADCQRVCQPPAFV